MKKYTGLLFKLIRLRVFLIRDAKKRAKYLGDKGLFAEVGQDCYFTTRRIPMEPYMVKMHNNVYVLANVEFITHDIINDMLANMPQYKGKHTFAEYNMGTIEIMDNVVIGAKSIILPNVKIGPNAIVAAGSVVTKDVPQGVVVGGNPAKVIGKTDDLIKKRRALKNIPIDKNSLEEIMSYYWLENRKEQEL